MHARIPALWAAVLLAAPVLSAQNVRDRVLLSDNLGSGQVDSIGLTSDGDYTYAAYIDDFGTEGVFVRRSDGRGLAWSPPVRIDASSANKNASDRSGFIHAKGDGVYVAWKDDRHDPDDETLTEIYFTLSLNAGLTWAPVRRIANGYPVATQPVEDYRFVVDDNGTPGPLDDHIYFLIASEGNGPQLEEELYLTASHDGGLTFEQPVHVPQSIAPGAADIDMLSLDADGLTVHVAFSHHKAGGSTLEDDVFYQRSDDGGATWLPADVRLNDDVPGDAGFAGMLISDGSLVFVLWDEERITPGIDELRAQVSTDGGASWRANDFVVGNYAPGSDDVDGLAAGIVDGKIYAAWDDNRTGFDQIYAAVSADAGASFTETVLSTPFLEAGAPCITPGMAFTGGAVNGAGHVVVSWQEDIGLVDREMLAFTRDQGAGWSPPVMYSQSTGDTDTTEVPLAYNALYNNFVAAWEGDDTGVNLAYAGGIRPQTLELVGDFEAGGAVRFRGRFWPQSDTGRSMQVVGSNDLGNFLVDGVRNLGLDRTTPVYSKVLQGSFRSAITPNGNALTVIRNIPASIPPGFTVYFAAASMVGGRTVFNMTDILAVTTP